MITSNKHVDNHNNNNYNNNNNNNNAASISPPKRFWPFRSSSPALSQSSQQSQSSQFSQQSQLSQQSQSPPLQPQPQSPKQSQPAPMRNKPVVNTSNSFSSIYCEGFLYKLDGRKGGRKSWKKRWFVLQDHVLYFYSDANLSRELDLNNNNNNNNHNNNNNNNGDDESSPSKATLTEPVVGIVNDAPELGVMPLQQLQVLHFPLALPPPWEENAKSCFACLKEFSMTLWRHHCRHCGRTFCAECSSKFSPIAKFGMNSPVRVCHTCYDVVAQEHKAWGITWESKSTNPQTPRNLSEAASSPGGRVRPCSFCRSNDDCDC